MERGIMVLAMFVFLSSGFSQTGPGGVGSSDGTSNLEFWYMAQGESFDDGALVNTITDRSGNNRNITATGTERPQFTLTTTGLNNLSSLLFDGNDELETSYQGNSNENMSFGVIMNYSTSNELDIIIQHGGRNTMGVHSSGVYTDFVGGSNHISSSPIPTEWIYHNKTFANTGTNRLNFLENSSQTDNFTHNIENRVSNTWIGGAGVGGGTDFNGSIAEVYKYSKVLNSAEQLIIANYLAAKYNLTLSSNDIYNEDNTGNGNYDHDVAGIGQASDGSNHTDSQGTGIVRISNPRGLGNDEFLIWGHDNGVQQAIESVDVPAGVLARFERVWRVSEVSTSGTGVNVGAVDMRFDLSTLGPIDASDLRLLVDTDRDGIFSDESPISGATNPEGAIYQFTRVTTIANNRRFTLATASSLTPLPIDLLSFNAHVVDVNHVRLDWQTASETNNDFFTVERSSTGVDWEGIDDVNGAGNSSLTLSYTTYDTHPFTGISYYRLRQTDFNGQFTFSSIQTIVNERPRRLEAFPNPTDGFLNVYVTDLLLTAVTIVDSRGRKMPVIQSEHGNSIRLNISDYPSGMYLLYLQNSQETDVQVIIKQ